MARVSIEDGHLVVDVQGLDKLWAFKSRLTFLIGHVGGATTDPAIVSESAKGWRAPGTYVPGVITARTFRRRGQKIFWDVHKKAKAVVIDLEDESYQRLVIQVDDPRATVELIEGAVARRDEGRTL